MPVLRPVNGYRKRNMTEREKVMIGAVAVLIVAAMAYFGWQWLDQTAWFDVPNPPPPLPPVPASNPNPPTGAIYISTSPILSWEPGVGAVSHDVYFGVTYPPAFRGNQTSSSFIPGYLLEDRTYFWRIDEVNAYGTTTGPIWDFRIGGPPPR